MRSIPQPRGFTPHDCMETYELHWELFSVGGMSANKIPYFSCFLPRPRALKQIGSGHTLSVRFKKL